MDEHHYYGRKDKFILRCIASGKYEVSRRGYIVNLDFRQIGKPTVVAHNINQGYLVCALTDGLSKKTVFVHRVIALNFLPKPRGKYEINHIDGDKTNNHVDNLEWCTASHNQLHAYANGLDRAGGYYATSGEDKNTAKLTEDQVEQILTLRQTGQWSYKKLAAKYGVSASAIHLISIGKNWRKVYARVMSQEGG